MIALVTFIILGALAILWDIIVLSRCPHKDLTVSGFIYRLTRKYPILILVMGGALVWFFPKDIYPMIAGGLAIHFVGWRA